VKTAACIHGCNKHDRNMSNRCNK